MNATIRPFGLSVATFLVFASAALGQGPLTPPGPPGPMFKTLQQIEPRTPISSLPFTITNAGSYYLTTNLTATPGVTDGIMIAAHDVSLDLNGFALVGASNSHNGIAAIGIRTNITIRNGTVRNWTGIGVFMNDAHDGILEKLRVSNNGSSPLDGGIVVHTGFRVIDCTVNDNMGYGIVARYHANISGSTATGNSSYGIFANRATIQGCAANGNRSGIVADRGCTVSSCTATENQGDGILAGPGCTISECTATDNLVNGIVAGSGSAVSDCTAIDNAGDGIVAGAGSSVMGCTARSNEGDGISAAAGSTIRDCTATENTGDGIEVTEDCRVVENTCDGNGYLTGDGAGIRVTGQQNRIDSNLATDNDRGIHVTAIRNFIVRNSVRMSGSNYVIVAGNRIAQIVQPAVNSANITNANTGSTDGFTGVDPWANFSH